MTPLIDRASMRCYANGWEFSNMASEWLVAALTKATVYAIHILFWKCKKHLKNISIIAWHIGGLKETRDKTRVARASEPLSVICRIVQLFKAFQIKLKFLPNAPTGNNASLKEAMAWRRAGKNSLHEPMMTQPTHAWLTSLQCMMTSSHGNAFRVTGPLWGESTGYRWIPLTKGQLRGLWYFLGCQPKQTAEFPVT